MAAVARVERGFPHQAMHAGFGPQPAVGIGTVDLDRGALDAGDFAGALVDHGGRESAAIRPAQVHAQQHLRPVLGLGAARAGLDVQERATRIHLAGKHAHQLELPDALLELASVAIDFRVAGLVALGLDELQQLGRLRQAASDLVEFTDRGREPGTLTAEFLRSLRLVPDRRVAELAIEFFQPLALAVVLKGTPSARQGAA